MTNISNLQLPNSAHILRFNGVGVYTNLIPSLLWNNACCPIHHHRAPVFDNLASSVTSPLFQRWEVNDQKQMLAFDLAAASKQPSTGTL